MSLSTISISSDSMDETLGSPATSDYFARSDMQSDQKKFSEEDPSGDNSSDDASEAYETPPAQIILAFAPRHHLFSLLLLFSQVRSYP
ncbi:hypothetical protein Tco_0442545 [Tanacetum coccineum]